MFFFFQNSLLNYSDDTPPVLTTKPPRRKRTYKDWILVDEYETFEEALNDIKAEKIWSTYSSNQSSTSFRCNKVKKCSEQCQSGLRIVLHEKDFGVSVYVSRNPHNCDQLEQSKAKLDPELRQFIAMLYAKGLKRKAIEDEFIKARRPLPARYVLRNEIARLRRNDSGKGSISVAELQILLSQHNAIPDDDYTAYVLDHQIVDKDEVRFNFVVSCKKLLQLSLQSMVCNADTTYKLIWQGYPVGVTGHTDYNKKFHPTSISVSTNEDESDFAFTFGALKQGTKDALDQEWKPPILMADGAKAIPNGFRKVFGDGFLELMCWYHAKMAMLENIAVLIPKEDQEEVIRDIDLLHEAQNPQMFDKASRLFIEKYERYIEFVKYFSEQWLQLHRNWFKGASVDLGIKAPSNNNGLEVFNRTVKDEKTLRVRLPLQQFFNLLLTWIESWARRYDAGATTYYHNVDIDLPLQTKSYQWVKLKKEVRKHRVGNFYMIPADTDQTLENWNQTLRYESFEEYRLNVFQGWSTTVINDPVNWVNSKCNCPAFLDDYMCKHIVGIAICLKVFQPRLEAKQIPVGEKRKRGRPKLAKKALIKQ